MTPNRGRFATIKNPLNRPLHHLTPRSKSSLEEGHQAGLSEILNTVRRLTHMSMNFDLGSRWARPGGHGRAAQKMGGPLLWTEGTKAGNLATKTGSILIANPNIHPSRGAE
jgi:hypothetical protein